MAMLLVLLIAWEIAKLLLQDVVVHYTKKGKGVPGKTLKKQTEMKDYLKV